MTKLSFLESNQLEKINAFLNSISEKLTIELIAIIDGNLGLYESEHESKISFIDFEIHQGHSIYLYPMDSDWTDLGHVSLLSEYSNGIIDDNDLSLDTNSYDFENDDDIERLDNYFEKLDIDFMSWFVSCWDNAVGNKTLKHKFLISKHDTSDSFDLQNKKWVDNGDK